MLWLKKGKVLTILATKSARILYAILVLLATPVFASSAESKKPVIVSGDPEVGRFEIISTIMAGIPRFLKLDTKTGDAWEYAFVPEKGRFWIPIENIPMASKNANELSKIRAQPAHISDPEDFLPPKSNVRVELVK